MVSKMKKGYLAGLFSGVGATIAAVLIVVLLSGNFAGILGTGQNQNKVTNETSEAELSDEQVAILNKLGTLDKLVDKYFLNEIDQDELMTGIYKGYISSLGDPYSTYYTQEEYRALLESSSGTYCGVGAVVSQNPTTGIITIVKPFVGGPAYKAGMLPEDILYKVNGEEVTGDDISDVVSRMKGEEGTTVEISIVREGESEPLDFTITRAFIDVPTVEAKMLDDNLGYILVSEFDEITVEQFCDAVDDLEKQGMTGLIVDLRDNPGGLLDSVVKMLDRIVGKGLLVYTEDKNGRKNEWDAKTKEELKVPLVVLINGQSASASEIFAGAVQDYKAGTLVGTTSFGKGIVQSVRPLKDGTAVKLTISKYYTPNGRNIHGTGIEPDVEEELSDDLKSKVVIDPSEDNQLQKAIEVLKDKISNQ